MQCCGFSLFLGGIPVKKIVDCGVVQDFVFQDAVLRGKKILNYGGFMVLISSAVCGIFD